jgi:glycosyltransferase involved in cell wall biosynthesis
VTPSISVVIPVRDGARYLREVLEAVQREGPDEVLIIDSGSRDGSPELAARLGVRVIEIPAGQFGHGRTRNLGAERTSGQLICFLTQDATPCPGWLEAYREAFALDPRVGAAFGPHLPRADTSPMIARELEEFFATFAPDGSPTVQGTGGHPYLSNANACYTRACWEAIRFRDIPYAEDQAFGRDMLAAGWLKVYHPGAAVLHAHDYPPLQFMRRYFDEYRGLRQTLGHVEPFGVRWAVRAVGSRVAGDVRWMRVRGWGRRRRAAWAARALIHHSGRKVFSALGSRADALPGPVQRALSLERRGDASPAGPPNDSRPQA